MSSLSDTESALNCVMTAFALQVGSAGVTGVGVASFILLAIDLLAGLFLLGCLIIVAVPAALLAFGVLLFFQSIVLTKSALRTRG